MSISIIAPSSTRDNAAKHEEWLRILETLLKDVEAWSASFGWVTERSQTEVDEGYFEIGKPISMGVYPVPMLTIATNLPRVTPFDRLIIEPISAGIARGMGRVDFYAYPAMYRVMLLHTPDKAEKWTVRTDSGIDWPHGWNQETFYNLSVALSKP